MISHLEATGQWHVGKKLVCWIKHLLLLPTLDLNCLNYLTDIDGTQKKNSVFLEH